MKVGVNVCSGEGFALVCWSSLLTGMKCC